MASPPEITLQNLNGVFVLNKSLSTDTDAILALQGIGWLMRKAISVATVTLAISETVQPNSDDPANAPVTKIVVNQTATGNIKSTESRTADWRVRPHTDRIFGSINGQSRLIRASKPDAGDGKVRPSVDVQTTPKEEKIVKFLKGEVDLEGNPDDGFIVDEIEDKDGVSYGEGEGLWLQNWVKSEAGWTAEQIWGFETINGQRWHTRRLVVTDKSGKWLIGRLVYDYQGPNEQ
ncbi:hypothetical protein UA08_04838 [Talaromyces atroroseus]|uniref:Uncharacterized protein n=1 Tax=Talaromyces atroroseus TaxID=1441469 RepID=A0A225B2U2_TALAT|nr:hypothetical protein UA08_04838 [Talaromyces atroroseus]OKL60177.1 hypothetical protein UA08_04838 [Talaromyces atroroseus]